MLTRSLRENENASDDECCNDRRRDGPAQRQTTVAHWLVEEIANRRAERSRQDERSPKQKDARHFGPDIGRGKNRQSGCKDQRPTVIAKSGIVGGPIAQCRSQRLRERNRHPVERLHLRRVDSRNRDRALTTRRA